jgi:hypothetical protein
MDTSLFRAGVLLAATLFWLPVPAWGANYGSSPRVLGGTGVSARSQSFVVTAPTADLAREVCEAAERFRRDLAIEWLGEELPPWRDMCPIHVSVGPHLGAGGETSFSFVNGEPRDWRMHIQGSRERILDSVLPHEISHTIFATHFGQPLPRWADEGAATSVEHHSERAKQERLLIQFLKTDRGIAFNHMFAMKDYPRDILPIYSQGYSLARYLIALGGRRKFVDYVGDGMKWNNWTLATQRHYGISSLHELQVTWLDWVRKGSPPLAPAAPLVAQTRAEPVLPAAPAADALAGRLTPLPSPAPSVPADVSSLSTDDAGPGWYQKIRDEARGADSATPLPDPRPSPTDVPGSLERTQQLGRPQAPRGPGQIILQWNRSDPQRAPDGSGTIWR